MRAPPDLSDTIETLIASGMTETEIADELTRAGIEVTQGTINRIKSGAIRRTSFEIGMGLMRLHERRASTKSAVRACAK